MVIYKVKNKGGDSMKLDEKTIKLIEKAKESGEWESNFLLKLDLIDQGNSLWSEYSNYKVLEGKVTEVLINETVKQEGTEKTVILIPEERSTVIQYWYKRRCEHTTGIEEEYKEIVYVFTETGWKSVVVADE